MKEFTLEKFEEASELVQKVTSETKLVFSEFFSEQSGNKVYFKPENMQYTGAYKLRGAYYKISTLSDEEKAKGIVTASAGNHAQGVAYAAKLAGIKATVFMPTTTPLIKINRTKNYGATVELYGDVFDEAATKIIKELPTVDIILVPIGGGGLCAGVATLAKMLNPNIHVIGVEPENAACMKESIKEGHIVTLPSANTIADGTAVKTPGDKLFNYVKENVDDIITINDNELIVSFLDMVENHKMIVENSGLLTVAALKHLDVKGKKIVAILSGGNMDVITMASLIQHGLIARDRIFTVSVLLPDKPGELAKVADLLASERGNVIKLEHNQFISINRNAAVELRITIEAYGTKHKEQIVERLNKEGYRPKLVRSKGTYNA